MIQIVIWLSLLYYIGKAHYDLAYRNDKNGWGFAVLGIATYYFTVFCFGILLGISDFILQTNILSTDTVLLSLIGMPFGLLGTYFLYKLLKKKWEKGPKLLHSNDDIIDDSIFID